MPGFNPENINIHDLTIEEPEQKQETFFDAEKEISGEDWEKIWETFESLKKEKAWGEVFKMGANMKTVDSTVDLRIPTQGWGSMNQLFLTDRAGGMWYRAASDGVEMKTVNPHVELGLNQTMYKKMEEELENMGKGNWKYGTWTSFFDMAGKLKILFPDNNFDPGKYVVGERKSNMEEELREKMEREDDNVFWNLAAMKMVGYHPDFDGKDLDYWKKRLDGNRTARIWRSDRPEKIGSWDEFIKTSAALKILAAEKVEVTDDGLKLTMPEKKVIENEPQPMPEKRKF